MAKMILAGIAAVLVAILAGFLWGASGRSTIERALERSELRNELLEARGAALAARIDIYNTNFGEASRHLEGARASVTRAVQRLEGLDREDEMQRLQSALGPIEEAQRLASKLDLGANARAAEAITTLESVLETAGRP
jgi:chromosome segregation ATPase